MNREPGALLDALLRLLRDGKWHSLDQIALELCVSERKLLMALRFLAEYSFVELEEEQRRARITS